MKRKIELARFNDQECLTKRRIYKMQKEESVE